MAQTISSLDIVLNGVVGPFVKSFEQAGQTVQQFNNVVQSVNINALNQSLGGGVGLLRGWSQALTGLARTFIRASVAALGLSAAWQAIKTASGGIELASEIEQTTVALETMLGSADQARELLAEIKQFAALTPFRFSETATAAKMLIAYGSAAGNVTEELQILGDISSGSGKNLLELVALYGKLREQQRAYAIDIRQLAHSGIPIYDALAKTMHVNVSEIQQMVKHGQVGFNDVGKALQSLTKDGGRFHNMMERQMTTMAGLWSNFADNLGFITSNILLHIVDLFGLRDVMRALIAGLAKASDVISFWLDHYGAYVVSWMSYLWGLETALWSGVYSIIQSFVGPIVQWVIDNWDVLATETIQTGLAIWSAVTAAWGAVWDVVQGVGAGLVMVWDWAMNALGLSTENAQIKTMTFGQRVLAIFKGVADGIQFFLGFATVTIRNWKDLLLLQYLEATLGVTRFANQVIYFFTVAIPYAADYWDRHWRTVIATAMNWTEAVFKNLGTNIVNIVKNLPGLLEGSVKWDDIWVPLQKGFHSAIVETFQLPEREKGALETGLGLEIEKIKGTLGKAYGDLFKKPDQGQEGQAGGILDRLKGWWDTTKWDWLGLTDMSIPEKAKAALPKTPLFGADEFSPKTTAEKNPLVRVSEATAQRLKYEAALGRTHPNSSLVSLMQKQNDLTEVTNEKLDEMDGTLGDFSEVVGGEADL